MTRWGKVAKAEFEALVTSAARGVDAGVIDALPKLRVISSFGVGLDKIDVEAAKRRDIAVGYTPDVLNDCVVDEAALVRALADRRIAGAGLDVFEHEPNVPRELFALDNVALLPHVAGATGETRAAMAERVADNLKSFFATGRLLSAAP